LANARNKTNIQGEYRVYKSFVGGIKKINLKE
jgi:hypothetical protein